MGVGRLGAGQPARRRDGSTGSRNRPGRATSYPMPPLRPHASTEFLRRVRPGRDASVPQRPARSTRASTTAAPACPFCGYCQGFGLRRELPGQQHQHRPGRRAGHRRCELPDRPLRDADPPRRRATVRGVAYKTEPAEAEAEFVARAGLRLDPGDRVGAAVPVVGDPRPEQDDRPLSDLSHQGIGGSDLPRAAGVERGQPALSAAGRRSAACSCATCTWSTPRDLLSKGGSSRSTTPTRATPPIRLIKGCRRTPLGRRAVATGSTSCAPRAASLLLHRARRCRCYDNRVELDPGCAIRGGCRPPGPIPAPPYDLALAEVRGRPGGADHDRRRGRGSRLRHPEDRESRVRTRARHPARRHRPGHARCSTPIANRIPCGGSTSSTPRSCPRPGHPIRP